MADPQPPLLPPKAPQGLKDFVDCKVLTVTIPKGKVDWLDLGEDVPDPDLTVEPGDTPGSAKISISVFGLTILTLPASVDANGQLTVDTSSLSDVNVEAIKKAKDALDKWVKDLNDWLKHKGHKFGPPTIKNGGITLTKVPIAPPPQTTPPVQPVKPVPPKPAPPLEPPPGAGSPPPDSGSSKGGWCFLLVLLLVGVLGGGAIILSQALKPPSDAGASPTTLAFASPTVPAVTPFPTPFPITPPAPFITPFPITPPPAAPTPVPPTPTATLSPTPIAVVPSPSPAACVIPGSGSLQIAVSDGHLHGMGAAAAPVCPFSGSGLEMLGLLLSENILTPAAVTSIPAIPGIGITAAPDGNPAGKPIPISSAFAFRTTVTPGALSGCGTTIDGFEVICGQQKPPAAAVLVDVFYIDWTAPPAGTGILPFLNIDRDGQPTNNVKPTAQFPYATTVGGDGLLQVVSDAKGKHILQLVDEVTHKLKPTSAVQFSGTGAAGWIVFDVNPAARYLPGVYDYVGTDFKAPDVGFDVASPLGGAADPAKPDLAVFFFTPHVPNCGGSCDVK